MSNRHRRPRQAPPFQQTRRQPPRLFEIGWYGPDGEEIEITIDINDPTTDPFLIDLIHQMTDNCPHCNSHHQEDGHDGH
jgi:hypothetical protein